MAKYLLDTSALLAHYFDQAGADAVAALWQPGSERTAVSATAVAELRGRVHEELSDESEARTAADTYLNDLTECISVDRATAELAWQLRLATPHSGCRWWMP